MAQAQEFERCTCDKQNCVVLSHHVFPKKSASPQISYKISCKNCNKLVCITRSHGVSLHLKKEFAIRRGFNEEQGIRVDNFLRESA